MTLANMSPKSSSFCFRGVRSEIWDTMLVWISPRAVNAPVPVTIAFAWPTVTVVPYHQGNTSDAFTENNMFTWSCLTALGSEITGVHFSTLPLSPVRIAWSILKLLLSVENNRQSAGILSPWARMTISPGTTISERILRMWPFLNTLAESGEYSDNAYN